jgi:hypothetical protein
MFDHEKVERANPAGIAGMKAAINGRWVPASAFDQLLALYREALRDIEQSDPRFDTSR